MMLMMLMMIIMTMMMLQHSTHRLLSCALQDESHDHGHVHFVPQNTVFFNGRTGGRRRGQEEWFARNYTLGCTSNIEHCNITSKSLSLSLCLSPSPSQGDQQ